MQQNTGTIFKIYLLAGTDPEMQEGFIELWKHKGKNIGGKKQTFNFLDQIPDRLRKLLKREKIEWPPKTLKEQ